MDGIIAWKPSLRKKTEFRDATSGLPAKWRLRNERKNSILADASLLRYGRCFCLIFLANQTPYKI